MPARHRHSLGALDVTQIVGGASFGRPLMSEEEMEAVNSGGAECAPKVHGTSHTFSLRLEVIKMVLVT